MGESAMFADRMLTRPSDKGTILDTVIEIYDPSGAGL